MKKNYNIDSPFLDRRTKLLPCQKEKAIMLHFEKGWTIAAIARMFNLGTKTISKKTIEFILYPDRLEKCRTKPDKPAGKRKKKLVFKRVNNTRNYFKTLFPKNDVKATPISEDSYDGRKYPNALAMDERLQWQSAKQNQLDNRNETE